MNAGTITTDRFGNRYAAVPVEELDEWAWMIGQLEDWLLHAAEDTVEDWASFTGPCGPPIKDVVYVLGHWSVRMRRFAEGRT
jgi:hypothetical protein